MHFIVLIILFALLIFGPQWWVRHVLERHNRKEEDFPGTGGELAQHLIDRLQLEGVSVEVAEGVGDHYDPLSKTVRLTKDKFERRTLTAIVTAAHEVGHAIQDAQQYPPFLWRLRLASVAQTSEKIGSFLLFSVPVLALITRAPGAGLLMFLAAFLTLGLGLVVQFLNLPVEWDASFSRALPILEAGYIKKTQHRAARTILRACALTYVAASMAGLVNFWRWMRIMGR